MGANLDGQSVDYIFLIKSHFYYLADGIIIFRKVKETVKGVPSFTRSRRQ